MESWLIFGRFLTCRLHFLSIFVTNLCVLEPSLAFRQSLLEQFHQDLMLGRLFRYYLLLGLHCGIEQELLLSLLLLNLSLFYFVFSLVISHLLPFLQHRSLVLRITSITS